MQPCASCSGPALAMSAQDLQSLAVQPAGRWVPLLLSEAQPPVAGLALLLVALLLLAGWRAGRWQVPAGQAGQAGQLAVQLAVLLRRLQPVAHAPHPIAAAPVRPAAHPHDRPRRQPHRPVPLPRPCPPTAAQSPAGRSVACLAAGRPAPGGARAAQPDAAAAVAAAPPGPPPHRLHPAPPPPLHLPPPPLAAHARGRRTLLLWRRLQQAREGSKGRGSASAPAARSWPGTSGRWAGSPGNGTGGATG